MPKPVVFAISASWDDETSVWSRDCDDIAAAADAPTLDKLLARISAMVPDLLPDNLQISELREAKPAVACVPPPGS